MGICFSKDGSAKQKLIISGKIILMSIKLLKTLVGFLCMTVILLQGSASCLGSSEGDPIIYVMEKSHAFSPVFEGAELTYTFVVSNRGKAPLNIKRVTPS
jgi:hypothetical protein